MCTRRAEPLEPLELLKAGLAGLVWADVVGLPDAVVAAQLRELLAAGNVLHAAICARVASFDARDLGPADGLRTTRTWLAAFGRMSRGAASGWLSRARLLRQLPVLAGAAGRGLVSAEAVAKVGQLAERVGVAAVAGFDEILAGVAAAGRPADVHRACERIHAHLDPDGPDPDPHGDLERRQLTLSRSGTAVYLRGRLDPEGGAALLTALDALMRPPKLDEPATPAQRRADALVELARLHLRAGDLPTVGGYRPQLGVLVSPAALLGEHPRGGPGSASPATLTGAAASGDPVADTAPAGTSPPGTWPDGQAPGSPPLANPPPANPPPGEPPPGDLLPDDLLPGDLLPGAAPPGTSRPGGSPPQRPAGPGPAGADPLSAAGVAEPPERAWLNWVGEVPPALAQRLACDCEIWRVVLAPSTGLPLEVGRGQRLVPHHLRRALNARDRGCRWPGCDAPPEWTDGHHLLAWYLGGETNIDNLMLLCRWHHGLVHEGRWSIRLDRATGELHVRRPDGRPYELGPSQPWLGPTTRRDVAA